MSTVADVIKGIRYDLKDSGDVERFSDNRIMHYMNRFRIYVAAMMFREQIVAGIKSADIAVKASTATYAFLGSATDFFAEYGIQLKDKTNWLTKIDLGEYVSAGHNTSTRTGSEPTKYMILDTTMYIFDPIVSANGTATLWYYFIPAAFSTSTTSMPWGGLFDEAWREFTSILMLNTDSYSVEFEKSVFNSLEPEILSAVIGWSTQLKMIPKQSVGRRTKGDIRAHYE